MAVSDTRGNWPGLGMSVGPVAVRNICGHWFVIVTLMAVRGCWAGRSLSVGPVVACVMLVTIAVGGACGFVSRVGGHWCGLRPASKPGPCLG